MDEQNARNLRKAEEIERKYIIQLPDIAELEKMPDYTKSEITQIYLSAPRGVTHRVRRRRYKGETIYTETEKRRIDALSCVETEREIDERQFEELAKKQAIHRRPIEKVRHTFRFEGQLFEIDVYPGWKRTCILETELKFREENPHIPALLHVIREVTGRKGYSNADMSKRFPQEEKAFLSHKK